MEKVLAKKLLPLVNDIDKYLILQEYIDNRVETMRNYWKYRAQLQSCEDSKHCATKLWRELNNA